MGDAKCFSVKSTLTGYLFNVTRKSTGNAHFPNLDRSVITCSNIIFTHINIKHVNKQHNTTTGQSRANAGKADFSKAKLWPSNLQLAFL